MPHYIKDLVCTSTPYIDSKAYNSLADAVNAIGSKQTTLLVTDDKTVSSDLTIPSNITLSVSRGHPITIAAGITLTIGSFDGQGRLWQMFEGEGSVKFSAGAVEEVYPEWWKKNTTPGTTDMHNAVQSALNSLSTGGELDLLNDYLSIGKITVPSKQISIKGISRNLTTITFKTDGSNEVAALDTLAGAFIDIKNVAFVNAESGGMSNHGIYISDSYIKLERSRVSGFLDSGIYITNSPYAQIICNQFQYNGYGLHAEQGTKGVSALLVEGNNFQNNSIDNVCINGSHGLQLIGNSYEGAGHPTPTNADNCELRILNCEGVEIVGGYFEGVGSDPARSIYVSGTDFNYRSKGVVIQGTAITRSSDTTNTGVCIALDLCDGVNIFGNRITPGGPDTTIPAISIGAAYCLHALIGRNVNTMAATSKMVRVDDGKSYPYCVSSTYLKRESYTYRIASPSQGLNYATLIPADFVSANSMYPVGKNGAWLTGISVYSSSPRSAGSLSVTVYISNSPLVRLDADNTQTNSADISPYYIFLSPNTGLDVRISTSSDWATVAGGEEILVVISIDKILDID